LLRYVFSVPGTGLLLKATAGNITVRVADLIPATAKSPVTREQYRGQIQP